MVMSKIQYTSNGTLIELGIIKFRAKFIEIYLLCSFNSYDSNNNRKCLS